MRVSPKYISKLENNEIFVFGSNEAGIHGAGAAKLAHQQFGAIWGEKFGLQGQSFAIPTKDERIQTLHISKIRVYVDRFLVHACDNLNYNFLVTEIGCGLANFEPSEIAPLFRQALYRNNIYLPRRFVDVLAKEEPRDTRYALKKYYE